MNTKMVRSLLFYCIFYHCAIFYSSSENYPSEKELNNESSSYTLPYSELENSPRPSTKLKNSNFNYKSSPSFVKNVSADFTPNRLYAQVRHRDIVKRLPRRQILDEARTDDDQENINRLRAVVKKQKINTYYTEEGYEDAAYDHASHIRDAEFDENYDVDVSKKKDSRKNKNNYRINDGDDNNSNGDNKFNDSVELEKNDGNFPHYEHFQAWKEFGNNPKKLTESETWKLESDLMKKYQEAADNGEKEIPNDLGYLADNSEDSTDNSDEYNIISDTLINSNSEEDNTDDLMRLEKKSASTFRIVAAPINSTFKFRDTNVMSTESNNGNSTQGINVSTTPKIHYPSLSQIYETWKREGIEEKYEESSQSREGEHNLISKDYSTEKQSDKTFDDLEKVKQGNKKYVLLVRKPAVICNDSKSNDLYKKNNNYLKNNEVSTVLQPPLPPLLQSKQPTYAKFWSKNHNNDFTLKLAQQNGSKDTSVEENNIPSPIFIYHYHQKPYYRHQPTWKDLKNYILPSIEIIPPTRTSRSEYAYYNTEKRNGNNKPQHNNSRPEVLKNRFTFRIGSNTPEERQKFLVNKKKRNNEKVAFKSVKNSHHSVNERQSVGYRQKRNVQQLLNDPTKVVEQVIDEEISMRFPSNHTSDSNNSTTVKFPLIDETTKKDDNKINKENRSKIKQKILDTSNNIKYPFYYNDEILQSSPLKYIMNPQQMPDKTFGGYEFYNSRDKYLQCEEIDPDLSKIIPESNESMANHEPEMNLPRLRGLDDKILCYKAKYFDKNPLDNPLFYEREIKSPIIPKELNPFNFISRVSHLKSDPEENVYRRVSKKPEIIDIRPLESRKNEIIDPNHYEWSRPEHSTSWSNHAKKHRNRSNNTTTAFPFMPYQKLVYENVMDTIKNLTHLSKQKYPSTMNSRVKVSSRLKKVRKSPSISHYKNRQKVNNAFIYITTQTPDTFNDIPSFDEPHFKKPKFVPYRTNKVTYRTRKITRPVRGLSNKTIGYLKTVRVHKRQIDTSDLNVGESNGLITRINNTRKKKNKKPSANQHLDQSSVSTKQIAYTIIDRAKNFDSQKQNEHNNNITTEKTSRLKMKPSYTTIRRFDNDINKIIPSNTHGNLTKIDDRYDVHEENHDEETENPIVLKQKEKNNSDVSDNNPDDVEINSTSEQYSGSKNYDDKSSSDYDDDDDDEGEDDESDSYKKKNQNEEQVDRPFYKSDDDSTFDSKSHVDESNDSEDYREDKNGFFVTSDHEKDFERFSSRPFSPSQNYHDPKYAHLGPRINKPAFLHPSFESIHSNNDDEKYHDSSMSEEEHENKYGMSKWMFPWNKDDEKSSERIKKYGMASKTYEFPWERRARLRAMREEIDRRLAEDHYPSETMTKYERIYPWESSLKFGFNKFGSNFWKNDDDFDSHGMNSELYPMKYRHQKRIRPKSLKEMSEELVNPHKETQTNLTDTQTTMRTTVAQTPATSVEFIAEKNKSTTPTVTTPKEVWTVRQQSRRRGDRRNLDALKNNQLKLESKILVSSTAPAISLNKISKKRRLLKIYNNNNNNKFDMISSSTTIRPVHKKLLNSSVDGKSKIPTRKQIEHRSKVSKEEMITKTTFPLINHNKKRNQVNNTQIHKMIQKLSIVRNENPKRIIQTNKMVESHKGNLFTTTTTPISTLTNNRSQILSTTDQLLDDTIVGNMNITDSSEGDSNDQESIETSIF